jgi:hypothetical protein
MPIHSHTVQTAGAFCEPPLQILLARKYRGFGSGLIVSEAQSNGAMLEKPLENLWKTGRES